MAHGYIAQVRSSKGCLFRRRRAGSGIGKLLDITLGQYRRRLQRYERDLREFENRHTMDLATFYKRFEAGELGDATDFFEWAGVYELRQDILQKIGRLESVS